MRKGKANGNIIYIFLIIFAASIPCLGEWWNPKNKTTEEINTAYYCAEKDHFGNWTRHSKYSMDTFNALLEVFFYIHRSSYIVHEIPKFENTYNSRDRNKWERLCRT